MRNAVVTSIISLALLAGLAYGSYCVQAKQSESEHDEACNMPNHVLSHLSQVSNRQPGSNEFHYYGLLFEQTPTTARLDGTGVKDALVFAAWIYAMDTGDYSATVAKVVDAGYFPYDVVPSDVNPEGGFYGYTSRSKLFDEDLRGIGTPKWRLRAKNRTLSAFYEDYYFALSGSSSTAVAQSAEDLGDPAGLKRLPQFWHNPLNGQPAVESAGAGNLYCLPLMTFGGEQQANLDPTDDRREWQAAVFRVE